LIPKGFDANQLKSFVTELRPRDPTKDAPIDLRCGDLACTQSNDPTPDVVDMKRVIGPDGRWLTLADLPLPNTTRWVIRRKAEVLTAMRGGLLSLEDACSRYALSREEVLSWRQKIARFGLKGLRTTRSQFYRETREVGDSGPSPASLIAIEPTTLGFAAARSAVTTATNRDCPSSKFLRQEAARFKAK
jgi:Protein of unknown function (DUF1153)